MFLTSFQIFSVPNNRVEEPVNLENFLKVRMPFNGDYDSTNLQTSILGFKLHLVISFKNFLCRKLFKKFYL